MPFTHRFNFKIIRNLFLILLLSGLLVAGYAVFIEPGQITVTEKTIALPGWSAELSELRVAALSDLHIGFGRMTMNKLREVVQRTNEQNPDLILLAGDFVSPRWNNDHVAKIEPEEFIVELKNLRATSGVFAVLGNHDWWYGPERVRMAFEQAGIPVLQNQAIQIQRAGRHFWLAGIGDQWTLNHDIHKTLLGVTSDAPLIAFTHTPDVFAELPSRFNLLIAGHTHGGQINLPFIGAPAVPSRFHKRYLRDHIIENGRHLFVTPGIGMSILPVRFRVPPEISVLRIVPEA